MPGPGRLEGLSIADDPCRIACHDGVGWEGPCDHRACSDDGAFSDRDAPQDPHPGCNPHVVLDRDLALEFRLFPDRGFQIVQGVILRDDGCAVADSDVVADLHFSVAVDEHVVVNRDVPSDRDPFRMKEQRACPDPDRLDLFAEALEQAVAQKLADRGGNEADEIVEEDEEKSTKHVTKRVLTLLSLLPQGTKLFENHETESCSLEKGGRGGSGTSVLLLSQSRFRF